MQQQGRLRWKFGAGFYREGESAHTVARRQNRWMLPVHIGLTIVTLGVWGVLVWLPTAIHHRVVSHRHEAYIDRQTRRS